MARLDERSVADERTDTPFDSLLRHVAHASLPKPSASEPRLQPGHTLLNGRLRLLRRIGEGGMGVVYEAIDSQRRGSVALKTLSRLGPAEVYRLKNEFRSLAEVRHPGVCRLLELFCENDHWFFTMELVRGVRFDEWVRPRGVLDEPLARDAFARLVAAIAAIHESGKLHRDLKPSNVLVADDGRVVVLDFGLAVDPEPGGIGQTLSRERVSGTPGYMAPEQVAGAAATAESDLYAVGVMLFQALTGTLPFNGTIGSVLGRKQYETAPGVAELAPDAPADLATLADALLEREAKRRPALDTVLMSLGEGTLRRPSRLVSRLPEPDALLGRDEELSALRAAYADTLSGQAVALFVAGESGIGKSALISCFLEELKREGEAAVLSGRCYEQESVPFKAFDAVVDDLSRYLRKLSREAAGDLMPRDVFALARLFPVLDRVEAILHAPRRDLSDSQELQHRAFVAFGELLARIRDRRPLVLYIDDLQWTCRDSSRCMAALLSLPDPPPLLLIASYRSERAEQNALLQEAFAAAGTNRAIAIRKLRVSELSEAAAMALARRALPDAAPEQLAAIAREAHGSPFFVSQLSHRSQLVDAAPPTVQGTVLRRVAGLPDAARGLLETLAVAGRPLSVRVALEASGADDDVRDVLLFERLVRMAGSGHERLVECYHDRIRESVVAALDASALRQRHARLAQTLAACDDADQEHLAVHFHGAGEHARASGHYEQAGDASLSALAFDYAARQFERALELADAGEERALELQLKLAAALASAGRSREAANAYRSAALRVEPVRSLELVRTAAHLMMTSGYVDEGRELLGQVLQSIGLSLPSSRRRAVASALWSRARLSLRGMQTSAAPPVVPAVRARLAALWTVVQGSVGNDPFLMVEMSARYARLALDHGQCDHGARALGMEVYLTSFDGAGTQRRNTLLVTRAAELAARAREPAVVGWVKLVHGAALVHEGRFAEGKRVLVDALAWLNQSCSEVPFELAGVRVYTQDASFHLGEHAEVARAAPGQVEDALRRGDMYQAILLSTGFAAPAWLSHGGMALAGPHLERARRRIQRQRHYQWSDYMLLLAELYAGLYEGRHRELLALVDTQWSALEESQLLRLQLCRALTHFCCGGMALAKLRGAKVPLADDRACLQRHLRALRGAKLHYAPGFSALLEAGLALFERREADAEARLRFAVACLDAADMRMHAACARLRLGQLLGGDDGRAWLGAAQATFVAEAVLEPEAVADMFAPGCRAPGD